MLDWILIAGPTAFGLLLGLIGWCAYCYAGGLEQQDREDRDI